MQILTPSGYRDISSCAVGDEVCAFDLATGAPIVNTIETLQWVDTAEWVRWWSVEPETPPFEFYLINGKWALNSEQSIWRNGTNVCHARHLVVGDVIYDDTDHDVTITSIEEVAADGWWRFDISGDHSYILDGLTVHNASRFWVLGTGTWDSSTTTNWAASTGGAGGQTVPGSADTVTFDGSSGGGTVTLNFGGTITIQSLAAGAFTGTLDNSVNNNNITASINGTAFSFTGTGTRTIKLGTATYTISGNSSSPTWTIATTTNLTLTASSATVSFTGNAGTRTFIGGSQSYGTLSLGATNMAGAGRYVINTGSGAGNTFGNFNITAPNVVIITALTNHTISNAFTWSGSSGSAIGVTSDTPGSQVTINAAAGSTAQWAAFRDIGFTGSPTATNSFNLGENTGITITGPSSGGGAGVIGS